MELKKRAVRGIAAVVLAMGFAQAAYATNGYFSNGYNADAKAMAGAGVAVNNGVLGLAQNPALGTATGNQSEACINVFLPNRTATVGGAAPLTPGSYHSRNSYFIIPCMGANFKLNDRSTLGFLIYANGGMNTEYSGNPFAGLGAGSSPLGVNLEQVFISANYAFDVNDSLSVGVAPIFALQRFEAYGLQAFAPLSSNPARVTNQGIDTKTGWGANFGLAWRPSDAWTFGASYRSKINMGKFDRYAGLFAGQGGFDIPATAIVGAAYTPAANPALTLSAEYQRIFYGDVASIANSGALLGGAPLGAANGPGFGWQDMDVVRLGAIYKANPKLTLRGGISYASDFLKNSNEVLFNILAPATPKWHASIGASYRLSDKLKLTGAYTHAFDAQVIGANLTPGFGQPVGLSMFQNELSIGLSYKF